jgi:predicted LPLAT superfamily acyltransferase
VTTTLRLVKVAQPTLPSLGQDAEGTAIEWHPNTIAWWKMWSDSELSKDFTATDWSFLIDTALMHHAMWSKGQWTLAAEVRLRVAKFGATPEDRARLRIVFESADDAEDKGRRRRAATGVKQPAKKGGKSGSHDPRSILSAVS